MASPDPARTVVDIVTGTWRAQALHAAVTLRLPDLVAAGHDTGPDLAAKADADTDAVVRLMRLLTAIGVFDGDETGYRPTAVSELLRDVPGSMRDMCLLYGAEFHQAWGATAEAVRTGRSGFAHAFGRTLHGYLADEPDAGPRFLRAMNAGSVFFTDVPEVHDFAGSRVIADIAGGSGMLLSTVLKANPDAVGVLFDREHMLATARAHLASTLEPGRFEVVAGDFFDAVPEGADTYLLSRVLQDWDDDSCVTLLTNVRRAMSEDSARLVIVDRIIEGDRVLPLLYDLHLLMMAGGRQRTLDGYRSLLAASGLRLLAVHGLALENSLLVVGPE
ncbi:methyltransferase [Actinokineospora sp. UTMC 2448]|uniref:methyltransferase n=1 Tax=Actinokineospora sp. UTMC 2448 TaxID=2268449 RepID=UPI00216441E3|nr:methyltransferase [Actinokineospora sp. UTMC 2448]UVS81459.1 Multifunctional cyclase-dehydratase-3-O-methyl transferase TcmN [Actinokineospora sp. UTMC 2448]